MRCRRPDPVSWGQVNRAEAPSRGFTQNSLTLAAEKGRNRFGPATAVAIRSASPRSDRGTGERRISPAGAGTRLGLTAGWVRLISEPSRSRLPAVPCQDRRTKEPAAAEPGGQEFLRRMQPNTACESTQPLHPMHIRNAKRRPGCSQGAIAEKRGRGRISICHSDRSITVQPHNGGVDASGVIHGSRGEGRWLTFG